MTLGGPFDIGSTSTAGQVLDAPDRVQTVEWHARAKNAGMVYMGRSDVSTTNGREITPGESWEPNLGQGSGPFSLWYVAFEVSGDIVDWTIIQRPEIDT